MIERKGDGIRKNEGKTRHDLIPAFANEQYAKVLTFGASKYAERNWEKGMNWSKIIASLKRHTHAIETGEDYDQDSGLLHSAHIMCNAAILTEYYKTYPQGDDRPHLYLTSFKIGLDIDEVICNFTSGWAKKFNITAKPEAWYYDRLMGKRFADMKKKRELDKFYLGLKPKIKASDIPFEPSCYVTSRPIDSSVTEKWLDKHGFPAAPVITVPLGSSKVDAIKKAGIDIFVDDRYENFVELNKAGICTYLFDAPHNNRYRVGHKRIKNLSELLYK